MQTKHGTLLLASHIMGNLASCQQQRMYPKKNLAWYLKIKNAVILDKCNDRIKVYWELADTPCENAVRC